MKVPTYSKFGLTKTQLEYREERDKKISDILTHHLTIITGSAFGVFVYIINYTKIEPSNFFQMLVQIFLFASIGVLCIGVPAVLFKVTEILYFRFVRDRSKEHKDIQKYKKQRGIFDFWKIREDFSFWKILDGLSFQKEVINIFLYDGFKVKSGLRYENSTKDVFMEKDGECVCIAFNTNVTAINDIDKINEKIELKNMFSADRLIIISQRGFSGKVQEYARKKGLETFDINGLTKLVKKVKSRVQIPAD